MVIECGPPVNGGPHFVFYRMAPGLHLSSGRRRKRIGNRLFGPKKDSMVFSAGLYRGAPPWTWMADPHGRGCQKALTGQSIS